MVQNLLNPDQPNDHIGCGECREVIRVALVVPDSAKRMDYCPFCGSDLILRFHKVPTVTPRVEGYYIGCPDGAVWGPYRSARVVKQRIWTWLRRYYGQEKEQEKIIRVDFKKGRQ